ncbi:MAG: hypothetical protein K9W45_01730 [Candidatus Heimdallarchaeum aukensis]|uniref:Uncharacterized protein n=1 Tax=Candidatus Heimdallarchaeum aukensis TaxID=2876573 RepID=A0A9Y1BLS1_9ARCH|nr:MAG: hypothetical protein K9W45_01730 [Candidatus Heimdallarchaeum aukensis]
MSTSFILGIIFLVSSLVTFVIVFSSKKIDFQKEKIFTSNVKDLITDKMRLSRKDKKSKKKRRRSIPSSVKTMSSEEETELPKSVRSPIPFAPMTLDEKLIESPELEMIEEAEETESLSLSVDKEEKTYSRNLMIKVPYNFCINEVFKLVIFIKKTGYALDELEITCSRVSSEEARLYSLTTEKLGKKLTEATVKLNGLNQGSMTVRAYFTNGIGYIVPSERNVYFDPDKEEIVAEFFITPTIWTSKTAYEIRIEFEQN